MNFLLRTFNEILRERHFLKPSTADFRREQLHRLLQASRDSIRKLDSFMSRLYDRTKPPPDLNAIPDIQDALKQRANDLLHFHLALMSEPTKRQGAILPPTSDPGTPATKEKSPAGSSAGVEIGRKSSVRETKKEKDAGRRPPHKRDSSYGGGTPLLPPINTTAPTPKESALKAPPSPFQASVEEVPDEGTPEEKKLPNVEEYYMTPPDTDDASSSQNTQASSGASRNLAERLAQRRKARESMHFMQPPTFNPKENSNDFLSPYSGSRPKRTADADSKRWQPPVDDDFELYPPTDEELDATSDHSGSHSGVKVESLSAANTPIDSSRIPSPRPRRSSVSRKPPVPQFSGSSTAKQSPRYSPGHSPWVNSTSYEEGRFKGSDGKEKYSPRPSPKGAQQELANNRRRAATQGAKPPARPAGHAPYPTEGLFAANAGQRVFQMSGGARMGGGFQFSDPNDIFAEFMKHGSSDNDDLFSGPRLRKDESMRVHTGESPKDRPLPDPTPNPMPPPTTLRPDDSMHVHTGESPRESAQSSMANSTRDSMRESTSQAGQTPKSEAKVTERDVKVSLEEVFTGCTKRLVVTDSTAGLRKEVAIPIKPGLKAGTRVKFTKVYFDSERMVSDLHFIVAYKPHDTFTRHNDDLHHTVDIDLLESLCGWERYVNTICGKRIKLRSTEPTGPGWKDYKAGLGMPNSKKPDDRGDLVVGVNIKYPSTLSEEQKEGISKLLKG